MIESSSHIIYLERNEIDISKWDQCIMNAPNGLIYARSYYLDAMAENWSALVSGDYQYVMPLTWKRKYGITYLCQPAFTAQLGIFYKNDMNSLMIENFIDQTKLHFKFCEIHLNFANIVSETQVRANYVLDLGKSYPEIRKGYKKRLLENLKEAESHRLRYLDATNYAETIQLFKSQYGKRLPYVRDKDYRHFESLCKELIRRNMIFVRQVEDVSGGLLNSSIFFRDERRIYNIMSVSLPAGREKRAHFFLLDHLIMEFASKDMWLDLEGSEVPGIAEFYRKFGTENQSYPFLKYNQLPFIIRFFK